jgi:hypothetical protein
VKAQLSIASLLPKEQKAWIDVKSPYFSYFYDYTRYSHWGNGIWYETCDFSNLSQMNPIADTCNVYGIGKAISKVVISYSKN